jgi:DNA-binding transcriptional LysR family regulator
VQTFLSSVRVGSVNGAARATGVTPSQVSKAVTRLERHFGVELVVRGPRGIVLTEDGKRLVPQMGRLLELCDAMGRPEERSDLTIVGTSFLNDHFLPAIAAALPEMRIHSLQAAPAVPTAFAGQPIFDIVLSVGRHPWPSSFVALEVGTVRRALFGSPAAAERLGKRTTEDTLSSEEFIGAIYSDGVQTHTGDDGCPLAARVRRIRHRTETAALALSIACTTSQLVFAPTLAARPFVERGQLVEIAVRGWNVHDALYLVCHRERVHARVQRAIAAAMKETLGTATPTETYRSKRH